MLQSPRLSRSERVALAAAFAVSVLLRGVAFFRYRFDSDEPQHLHVAWGWTAGLVQYRDIFDNHSPLFHLATAPLLALAGERPDILVTMRAPMLVLWAAVLACTFVVGRRLFDTRVAATAVVLLSLFPAFFLKSLEYRNDNLWNALWMLSVVVLTGGPVTPLRFFLMGLLLGAAAAASLKTIVLVITLLICAVATRLFCGGDVPLRRWIAAVAAAAAGLAIIPAAIALVFVRLGAWPSLVYCLFTFFTTMSMHPHDVIARAIYPFAIAVVLYIAYRVSRDTTYDLPRRWRFFFRLFFAVFTVNVGCWWVLVSPRDFLTVMPIGALIFTAALQRWRLPHVSFVTLFLAVALTFAGFVVYYAEGFANRTAWHVTMMRQALGLTRPGEPLMDYKGETVYRHRPFYFILEVITREQMLRGLIPDTVERDVIAARCHVAQADGPFWPPRARRFLNANFLDMGRLRASGQWLTMDGGFTIAVPGEYVIVEYDGEAHGELDGTPYRGARYLAPGPHRFVDTVGPRRLAALWAPAWNRGYSPFDLKDRDF